MQQHTKIKQLMKILIGAAWIDGRVQPEERKYLYKTAQENQVADDPEIKPLLYELRTVPPAECYGWLEAYFGQKPSQQEYQCLIEAISGLIYSDGSVASEEAKLLTRLQLLDPARESSHSTFGKVLTTVQKLYRRWLD